ncbi:hypothetical protein SALBM135S_01882 [Streptomyces alboniger]
MNSRTTSGPGPYPHTVPETAGRTLPVKLRARERGVAPQIAPLLGAVAVLSTVRKHLENIFHRLGVSSRTAAVARIFPEPSPYES